MAPAREVEQRTTAACTIESGALAIPSTAGAEELGVGGGGWKLTAATPAAAATAIKNNEDDELFERMANDAIHHGDDGEAGGNPPPGVVITVECRSMPQGTTVRIPPMERTHRGWHADHFHPRLRLPDNAKGTGRGIIVLLQARSSECLAVALSPAHDYELGKTYVVHFGADGNTRTVLRRHLNYNECVESSYSSRVCSEATWISYWICLQHGGMLSAGIGSTPGQYCIGTLDDTMYDALRSGVDAVRYVGIGNSALRRNARDVRVRNVIVCGIPSHFGLVGVPINGRDDGTLINVDSLFGGEKILIDNNNDSGGGMPTDEELLAEYDKERLKARARAAKFGIEYTEPAAEAFLKWSECRRLRANPEKGFITGIDTFSIEELAKADARRLRFAKPGEETTKKKKRKGGGDEEGEEGGDGDDDDDEGDENRNDDESDDEAMNDDDNKDDVAEWEKTKQDPLPIEQAWENWKLVKHFRIDPPQSLLLPDLTTPTNTPVVTVIPTKIHVFAIDWACFKQIRTDDIMSYFKDYGPSYVEWLGELSCNVHFEDRHTAARAFRALSRELPTPPPKCISSVMETGAVLSVDNTIKGWARDADGNFILDELGRRTFASDDVPMGNGDVVDVTITENGVVGEKDLLPDFASMGWRFCKWTVRKVSNDRYGKRGTRARVLMRLATSIDVLDDRPTEWPKPPPGFTTKRVLMPWHDFSGKRRGGGGSGTGGRRGENNKRRKRGSEGKGGRRSNGGGQRDVPVEERMSTGLRAGR